MTPEKKHPDVDQLLLNRMIGNGDPTANLLNDKLIGKDGKLIPMPSKNGSGTPSKAIETNVYLGKAYSTPAHPENNVPRSPNGDDNEPNPSTANIRVDRWDIPIQQSWNPETINPRASTPNHPTTDGVRRSTRKRLKFASFSDEILFRPKPRSDRTREGEEPSSRLKEAKSPYWDTE